jgi:hypothetical protein
MSVQPYALMLAPVYVFMRQNEKFVAVKGPLDFFTPEELDRYQVFGMFYIPEFVELALPFRQAGRRVRTLVGWQPQRAGEALLPPAPYEISDAVLRMIGPLWGAGLEIEPFFAAVFVNELCDLLSAEVLFAAREKGVQVFEQAVLRSSWAVFLALHLGYCDLAFLNAIRLRIFAEELGQKNPPANGRTGDVQELVEIVGLSLSEDALKRVRGESFALHESRTARKMSGRLERVRAQLVSEEDLSPTIFGPGGFAGG